MIDYTPRPGSLADLVISHLRKHPGTVLYPAQITKLFNCKSGNIAHNLHSALKNGVLVREGFARGVLYRLVGENDAAWVQQPGAQAEPQEPPLQVVIYGDGDVAVKGHAVSDHDAETSVFTLEQVAYLVSKVARPLVQVAP